MRRRTISIIGVSDTAGTRHNALYDAASSALYFYTNGAGGGPVCDVTAGLAITASEFTVI